jgi:hypothetical protein
VSESSNAILPRLLPRAIAWAEAQSEEIRARGKPLDSPQLRLANAVGVVRPELVRVLETSRVPVPKDPELREIALKSGLLGPTIGITFRVRHLFGQRLCNESADLSQMSTRAITLMQSCIDFQRGITVTEGRSAAKPQPQLGVG